MYAWGRGHEGQTGLALKHAPHAKHVDVTVTPKYVATLMRAPVGEYCLVDVVVRAFVTWMCPYLIPSAKCLEAVRAMLPFVSS